MTDDEIQKAKGRRLAIVRRAAGFDSARSAALACGWPESTYRSHENGSRTIGDNDARRYVVRFNARGAKGFTAQWVMFGSDEDDVGQSLDEMLKNQPAEVRKKAIRAVRSVLGSNLSKG
jgi:hypothetical protein